MTSMGLDTVNTKSYSLFYALCFLKGDCRKNIVAL